MKTMLKAQIAPAVPTTQVRRIKRMTPKMFWIQGRKQPMKVPILAASAGGAAPAPPPPPGVSVERT